MAQTLQFSNEELNHLRTAMNWVIPEDSSSGAGSDSCLQHLVALIQSLGDEMIERYVIRVHLLKRTDLEDRSNVFAQEFIDHVRDVYYGHPDTGAWNDIGFTREQ